MENYKYTVFFEAKSLSDVELEHIHKYFKIRKKSGGGECEIDKVGNNTYKIGFRSEKGKHFLLLRVFFTHLVPYFSLI